MQKEESKKESIVLLNCPFCGGEARLQRQGKKRGYYVICKKCGCRTPNYQYQFSSLEELNGQAIEAWNTRKPMEQIVARLEEEKGKSIYDSSATISVKDTWKKAIDIVRAGGKE